MKSLRRDYLDELLSENSGFITGKVLDAGGKKFNKKGDFDSAIYSESVTFLNSDSSSSPDIVASVEAIPASENSFDTIIATELLEYLDDPKFALKEFYRVSKNNAKLIISTPFLHPIHGDAEFDKLRFSKKYIEEITSDLGFKIISITPMGSTMSVIFDILKVNFGYASNSKFKNIFLRLLFLFKPIFRNLDRIFDHQKNFINTGYFIIIKKP